MFDLYIKFSKEDFPLSWWFFPFQTGQFKRPEMLFVSLLLHCLVLGWCHLLLMPVTHREAIICCLSFCPAYQSNSQILFKVIEKEKVMQNKDWSSLWGIWSHWYTPCTVINMTKVWLSTLHCGHTKKFLCKIHLDLEIPL